MTIIEIRGHQQRNQCMPLITTGGLSCLRLRAKYSLYPGGEARVESQKILLMVSSDVDVLFVHGDEGSHEEASERVLIVPGRDRT